MTPSLQLPHFAQRNREISPFLAMEVMERAFALERAGHSVVHLEIGEPGAPPPQAAVDACERALRQGFTRYTDSRGIPELREAIAAEHSARSGVPVSADRVLVTSGTSAAMQLVFSLLVDPGDEVILAAPHYSCYPNFIHVAGGRPVLITTRAEENYQLDPHQVRAVMTPRTRAIIVASPANPTGAVQERKTMQDLADLGVPLVSDEIYDGLVYDGVQTTSALAVSDHAYVLDGFSKRYAMTGFRLGYVIAPLHAVRPLQVLQQNLFISANHFVQYAGVAALEQGAASVAALRDDYAQRRTQLIQGLRELGFGLPSLPQGAFYALADARRFGGDSLKLAFALLERAHVACTPGIDYGQAAEGHLRFSFAASEEDIALGLERLGKVLPALEAEVMETRASKPRGKK